MVKEITITLIATIFSGAYLFAQPAGNQGEVLAPHSDRSGNDAGSLSFLSELDSLAEAVGNARNSATEYIAKKGWSEGLNDGGRYVVIGLSTIDVAPTDKNFQLYRINAYNKAMLEAKSEVAKYFSQEISTRASHVLIEPKSAERIKAEAESEAGISPTIIDKAVALVNKKLDNALEKEGITLESKKAEPIIEDLINESSYLNAVKSIAKSQVGALVTSKIFEQDGEIVVVAYYSDNTKLLAGAINGRGDVPKVKPRKGEPIRDWIKKLKLSQLYSSMGIQMTSDEDGNIVILSYGQSKARSKSATSKNMAYEKAVLEADQYIRNFAGETVVYAGEKEMMENSKEYLDNAVEMALDDSMKKKIETQADALKISGISTIRSWSITDPRSDSIICGVVRMWSIKTSDTANISREQMRDATTNRGGRTNAKKQSGSSVRSSTHQRSGSTQSLSGDQSKYKTQSIESEDF